MKRLFLFSVLLGLAPTAAEAQQLNFERHIAPILRVYCWNCHGSGGLDGKLDLRSQPLLLRGGKSGPAIVPGKPSQSLLYKRLVARQMPPDKTTHKNVVFSPVKPTKVHQETIRKWIEQGAKATYVNRGLNDIEDPVITPKDRSWWAFVPPKRARLPKVQVAQRVQTAVDSFILARLEAKKLTLAPRASRLTLIRRLYLDCLGIPPTPQQVDQFLSDHRPNAYQLLVDRLLSSPHFGERWGRHWLDAAGYVDTAGADNDANSINLQEGRWRYRDYVIQSLNADKPYDQFITEQMAGDELVDWQNAKRFDQRTRDLLAATGFLRQAADSTASKELNTGDIRNQVLISTVRLVGSNLLGLTIQCAQCHTHKFDPINHADYYRFRAFFEPGYNIQNWKGPKERMLYTVSKSTRKQIDSENSRIKAEVAKLSAANKTIRDAATARASAAKYKLHVPRPVAADVRIAIATNPKKRNAIQKYLVGKFASVLKVTPQEVNGQIAARDRQAMQARSAKIAELNSQVRSYGKFPALWEDSAPPRSYVFRRGEFEKPGPEVRANIPTVLNVSALPKRQQPTNRQSSGSRLQLARWMTQADHPLVARVYANRVWQRYFGRGIVATPDNFGSSGSKPTHPQLLDWLALEFVESGWSIKHLHRVILLSAVYQQATHRQDETQANSPAKTDPANLLLWKMPLRRLQSEIIRDSVLAVSEMLDRRAGGKPVPIKPLSDGMVEIDKSALAMPSDEFRRTIYVTSRRNYHLTQLDVFNQPIVTPNCTRRLHSPVVSQSLAMINGKFANLHAQRLAEQLTKTERTLDACIEAGFRKVLCRRPTKNETKLSRNLIVEVSKKYQATGKNAQQSQTEALQSFCLVLMNTSEFLYAE